MKVLVINAGSSSVKAQLMDTESGKVFANMYCQRIALDGSFMTYKRNGEKSTIEKAMPTHKEALQLVLDVLVDPKIGVINSLDEIGAIGHRIVNMGEKYTQSKVITPEIYNDMLKYVHFAPLHNPPALLGIKACMDLLPEVKNVGVFDTSFHATMPEKAYIYPIPYNYYKDYGIRRYGAHGTSHRYIAKKCEELLGGLEGKKIISCHIGSGSSLCAIKDGKCVDTTMGFTPLAGVVMGTRSGDIDPSILKNIMEIENVDINGAIDILNKKSGLLGLCGYSDLRDIDSNLDKPDVKRAFDIMIYSIKKYIGSYCAIMDGIDCLVFTAGVGENDDIVREAICKNMSYLGLEIDEELNKHFTRGIITKLSTPNSKVEVYIIPTDEEFMIASDTADLVK